ncbi:MAG: tetratricopeptide repeat protein [bacterium]|nr:tetratricopeptide repeat protein [bacterium]
MVRRITRKEIKKPDEFIKDTTKAFDFVLKNSSIFISVLLAIMVIAAVVFIVVFQGKKTEEKAQVFLYQAIRDFRGPTLDLSELGIPKPDEKAESPAEKTERVKMAEAKFLEIAEKYPKTQAAWQARFYLANCQYQLGDSLAAIDSYQKILDSKKLKDLNLTAMITYNLGFLYENLGYMDRAIEYYRSVMELGSNLYTQLIGEDLKRAQWKSEYLKQNRPQGMAPAGGPAAPGQPQPGIQLQLNPGAPPGEVAPGKTASEKTKPGKKTRGQKSKKP